MSATTAKIMSVSVVLIYAAMLLTGCSIGSPKPETQVISVPSSKPYRYIKYSPQCEIDTLKRIKRHNETHWKVKQAEAAQQ